VLRKRLASNFLPTHHTPPRLCFIYHFVYICDIYREQQGAERAVLSHSLCRFKPLTAFYSYLHLVTCSYIYLLNFLYQLFTYSSLSFSYTQTFSLCPPCQTRKVHTSSPLSFLIRSLLNGPGCTHCP
jgi:hypothetical protein